MSSFSRIAGLLALIASLATCVSSKTVMHEINGTVLLLIGTLLLCVGEIIDRLDVLVRNSEHNRSTPPPQPAEPKPLTAERLREQSPAPAGSSRRQRTWVDKLLGRPGTGPYLK